MGLEGNTDQATQNNTGSGDGLGTQQTDQGAGVDQAAADRVAAADKAVADKVVTDQAAVDKAAAIVAPEAYTDFNMPEGLTIDADMLGKFNILAKENNLSQENAQKLVDLVSDNTKETLAKEEEDYTKLRESWKESLKKDPDFGGAKYVETVERAKRTVAKHGSKLLTEFLDNSGYIDNNELIKLFARVDKLTSEDTLVDGTPSGGTKSIADTMYPNQGK